MVQIEVCDSEWKVNQALERLQNDGFNIQDIKFTYHNYTSKFMIIYDDNSEIKAMWDMLRTQPVTIFKEGEEPDVSSVYNNS
jgi:hypothetical protein